MTRASGTTIARRGTTAALAALLLAVAACDRDESTAPQEPLAGTITVDARNGWAYLSLEGETTLTPADPLTSDAWDMAFNALNVRLNGGQGGVGDAAGYCLCQNSSANPTNDEILAMTPESELGDFEAVDASDVPAAASFVADELQPALDAWYTGSGESATPTGTARLVRLHDGGTYAKLRVLDIEGPTASSPGTVTLEFATQAGVDGALGATQQLELEVPASGTVRVDLAAGTTTDSETAWDLRFEGWTVRVNGGASGPGQGAVAATELAYDDIADAYAGDDRAYRTDTYAGVFSEHPWYRYNLQGDHRISPTFDVYLVRRGGLTYKVQLIDYYDAAGDARHVTVRYERIGG